jgi:hypothetical protein
MLMMVAQKEKHLAYIYIFTILMRLIMTVPAEMPILSLHGLRDPTTPELRHLSYATQ